MPQRYAQMHKLHLCTTEMWVTISHADLAALHDFYQSLFFGEEIISMSTVCDIEVVVSETGAYTTRGWIDIRNLLTRLNVFPVGRFTVVALCESTNLNSRLLVVGSQNPDMPARTRTFTVEEHRKWPGNLNIRASFHSFSGGVRLPDINHAWLDRPGK